MKNPFIFSFLFIFTFLILYGVKSQSCIDTTLIDQSLSTKHCNDFINLDFNPVCGCDSNTYLNPKCAKYTSGVISYTPGGCKCIDSTIIDTTKIYPNLEFIIEPVCGCDGKAYINKRIAYFKYGVSRYQPLENCDCNSLNIFRDYDCNDDFINPISPPTVDYVCGCDSITYVNTCQAYFKGRVTKITHKGRCHCVDSSKIDISIPCEDVYNPVCGCDTITYKNACIAKNQYGIIKYTDGPCPCIIPSYIDSTFPCVPMVIYGYKGLVCGCDGITYENICIARKKYGIHKILEQPCICIDSSLINLQISCPDNFQPVCGCDKKTYINECVATYTKGIKYSEPKPCSCKDTNLVKVDKNCNSQFIKDPVCGCDSIIYINPCEAIYKNGITSYYKGYCSNICIANNLIDTSTFCSEIYNPVCGCDKITYTNQCIARNRYGVIRWEAGHCDSLTSTSNFFDDVFSIFPVPASDALNIECFNCLIQSYSVLNLQGQILLNKSSNQKNVLIDISYFLEGLYFIRIEILGKIYTRKIVLKK